MYREIREQDYESQLKDALDNRLAEDQESGYGLNISNKKIKKI